MKTTQEYPATHSMSTAWFAIDEDDNVAMIEFDENGPVPYAVSRENCIDNLVSSSLELFDDGRISPTLLQFDNRQLEEIMKNAKPWNDADFDNDFISGFVQIDLNKESEFLSVVNETKKEDFDVVCYSKELGIYFLDGYDRGAPQGPVRQIFTSGIVLSYYMVSLFNTNKWNAEKEELEFEHEVEGFPFYLYQQPYWVELLIQKTYTPKFPLKATQLHEKLLKRALHLPFRFEEKEKWQILQFYKSAPYSYDRETVFLGELQYQKFQDHYYLVSPFPEMDSRKCLLGLFDYDIHNANAENPTILYIAGLKNKRWYSDTFNDGLNPLLSHLGITRVINEGLSYYKGDYDKRDKIYEFVSIDFLQEVFARGKDHLERIIAFLQPYVLLIDDDVLQFLEQHYSISPADNDEMKIEIAEQILPLYYYSDMKKHWNKLIHYAEQPYRGTLARHSYSEEEMEEVLRTTTSPLD